MQILFTKKTGLIIGDFQSSLFLKPNLFFKRTYIRPKNNPTNIEIKKGLNNLKYPLLSTIVLSKNSIETMGANSWLPGKTNQIPDNRANNIIEKMNPNFRKEKRL